MAESDDVACGLVAAGVVRVQGAIADNPNRMVATGDPIVLEGPAPRFVGRGGEKLDFALDRFAIDVRGVKAIDVGASTGGFTDCLLQRGAASVVALDVGHGQLAVRLRADDRVRVVERTHVNDADLVALGAPFDVVVADLSFISLTRVAEVVVGQLPAPGANVVALVKPQFEVSKAVASRGKGVVIDAGERQASVERVASAFASFGATIMGVVESPITGASGNVEYLLHAVRAA